MSSQSVGSRFGHRHLRFLKMGIRHQHTQISQTVKFCHNSKTLSFQYGGWGDGSTSHRIRQSHVPVYESDFEMTQNSNHSFFFLFLLGILITCFFAEVAHFFQLENSEIAQNRKGIEFGAKMVRILSYLEIRCILCWHV